MDQFVNDVVNIVAAVKVNLPFVLSILGLLWLVQCVNALLGYRLNYLGIYPRSFFGLVGIVCSPFLHGNFNHLFFNSIPLFVLMSLVLVYGTTAFLHITGTIIVFSGAATWLLGRRAIHIGASNLIMGYWSFLLTLAISQHSTMTLILGAVCVYYLGGLVTGLVPTDKSVSWEGHVFGFIAGILVAYGWVI